jgi:hypothetical protein
MLRVALVIGLIVVGAIVGATLNFAAAYLAIPIGLALLGVLLLRDRHPAPQGPRPDRAQDEDRNRLGAKRLEFTERDRRTLT